MDKSRVESIKHDADKWQGYMCLHGPEVSELCDAWLELHKDKRLPSYPCPINEANEKVRELKEDSARMMDEIQRLRAENERLRKGAGGEAIQLIDLLVKRLPADAARLSKLEAVAEAARRVCRISPNCHLEGLHDAILSLDRKEG
ncbi:MAG: hypothetical protein ABFE13_11515 [Phycisphaerales bacterium]